MKKKYLRRKNIRNRQIMMIQSAIPTSLSLNIGGRLLSLDHPRVMGILNATPDSFYAGSRCGNDETIIANRHGPLSRKGAT